MNIIHCFNKGCSMLANEKMLLRYLTDLLHLKKVPISLAEVLMELLHKANYDNQIIINSTIKEEISGKLEFTVGTIDNAITRFVNSGILVRKGRGVYMPNPECCWDRKNEQNVENISMNVSYHDDVRKIQVIFNCTLE